MRPFSIDIHYETHSTSIFFQAWMVQSFCFWQSPTFFVKWHRQVSNHLAKFVFLCCFHEFFWTLRYCTAKTQTNSVMMLLWKLSWHCDRFNPTGWQFSSFFRKFLPSFVFLSFSRQIETVFSYLAYERFKLTNFINFWVNFDFCEFLCLFQSWFVLEVVLWISV